MLWRNSLGLKISESRFKIGKKLPYLLSYFETRILDTNISLNFGTAVADQFNMKKLDPFYMLILFIVSCLSTAYFAFDYHLSGITFEKQKVRALEDQVVQLQLKNEALLLQADGSGLLGRQIASLKNGKQISFDELYASQLEDAKLSQKTEVMKQVTEKIINNSANSELLAQAYFERASLSCQSSSNSFKDETCLEDVETTVSQFPESKWAKESLILLSSVYTKLRRFKEAESVIKIVKSEFAQR